MRKRFALISVAAMMAAALTLPGTAAAANGIFYRILDRDCTPTEMTYVVRFVAKGSSGANRLRVKTRIEQRAPYSSTWTGGVYYFPPVYYDYTDDGTRHFLHIDRSYPNNPGVEERIVVHLQAYGPDGILWGGLLNGLKC
jgi:hypothetical protein